MAQQWSHSKMYTNLRTRSCRSSPRRSYWWRQFIILTSSNSLGRACSPIRTKRCCSSWSTCLWVIYGTWSGAILTANSGGTECEFFLDIYCNSKSDHHLHPNCYEMIKMMLAHMTGFKNFDEIERMENCLQLSERLQIEMEDVQNFTLLANPAKLDSIDSSKRL